MLIIVLGLAFLGLIPGLQNEVRIRRLLEAGLLGAPVFGAVFALSWVPCLSPTLAAVLGLAGVGGSTGRAVALAIAYCLGIGLPFLAFGLACAAWREWSRRSGATRTGSPGSAA